jgi:ABC-type multidrug transport system fused ATPase/permease subunit
MRYPLLFIPYFLAVIFDSDPDISYMIAWLGSFWIFWLSISDRIKPLRKDLPLADQFMRPVILTQLIFAGYMAVTSIFFFLDLHEFAFTSKPLFHLNGWKWIPVVAKCQRMYCLAHACFTSALLFFERENNHLPNRFKVVTFNSESLLWFTGLFLVLSILSRFIPGMVQLLTRFTNLTLITSILALVFAIREKRRFLILFGWALFASNMLAAFLSGWKEVVLVPLIILFVLIYPNYKRLVIIVGVPFFILLLYFLPAYNEIVRAKSWSKGVESQKAATDALDKIRQGKVDVQDRNWDFLVLRISEIYMFTKYAQFVPDRHEYYGMQIASQALAALVPRVLIDNKENLEELVMKRVFEAGITSKRGNSISAKPAVVVDAYLSGAELGIVITFLIVGSLAAISSLECERLFGGYMQGSAWMYTGLFSVFWRGNCFEFMLGTVFWSFVVMYLLFIAGKQFGLIKRVP